MTDKKAPNYTDEQAAHMVEQYTACETDETRAACIDALSAETGRNVRSIRAKLVREGVYVAKAYVSKKGEKVERKGDIVQSIAKVLGVTEDQLGGLEKATKPALELIRAAFITAREELEEREGIESYQK